MSLDVQTSRLINARHIFERTPIIDEAALEAIVERTALRLRKGFSHGFLASHINQAIQSTLSVALLLPYQRNTFDALRGHLSEYARLALELAATEYPPPMPPKRWFDDATLWFTHVNKKLDDRARGGRPSKLQADVLFPRLLGLYASVFGKTPVITTRDASSNDGPTARFIRETLSQVCDRLEQAPFADASLLVRKHFLTSDEALRKAIQRAAERPSKQVKRPSKSGSKARGSTPLPVETGKKKAVRKQWQDFAKFYRDQAKSRRTDQDKT